MLVFLGKGKLILIIIMSRDYDIDYFELICKLEKRFNFVDLLEIL